MKKSLLGSISSSISKKFSDTFSRGDSATGLGKSEIGTTWRSLRGIIGISSNKAYPVSGNYPASVISATGKDIDITAISDSQYGNGTGIMLWATDADNWWAVDIYQESSTSCNSYCPDPNAGYYACGNYYTYNACGQYYYYQYCSSATTVRGNCNGFSHPYYKNTTYCTGYNYNLVCNAYAYATGCNYYYTVSGNNAYCPNAYYCCSSTTIYPKYIRVIRMIAGSISTMASQLISNDSNQNAAALKVEVRNDQITAKAYTDASMTTQAGSSLVYSPTGANITTDYGIVFTTQGYSQNNAGTTEVKIDRII